MRAIRVAATGAALLCALSLATSAGAVNFVFDYRYDTSGFFAAGSTARACLEAAAGFYESILEDDLTAINSSSQNRFDAVFYRPDREEVVTLTDFDVPADTMIVFMGSRDLPGNTLGWGGPGGYNVSYYDYAWVENALTRGQGNGQIADVQGGTAFDFGPWGGSITVDSLTSWHKDATSPPSGGKNDLLSTLLHELGHVLGIGTADSWYNLVNGSNQFTGSAAVAEHGGAISLDSYSYHWADGTMSHVYPDGALREAAMDPTLTVGTRKLMTDLDVAGLDDLGWEIQPQPGDANGDGVVDAADAAVLAAHWLATSGVGWDEGDFNRDGRVDDLDASILAANWRYEGGGAAAVPEPSAIAILLGAIGLLLMRRPGRETLGRTRG